MTRIPFPIWVAGVTALSGGVAALAAPGRFDVIASVALGTGVAGAFAAAAVAVINKARSAENQQNPYRLVNAFVGLMLARMIGYLAFLGGVVALKVGHPISVCIGLLSGTVVFQTIEILYLRKRT